MVQLMAHNCMVEQYYNYHMVLFELIFINSFSIYFFRRFARGHLDEAAGWSDIKLLHLLQLISTLQVLLFLALQLLGSDDLVGHLLEIAAVGLEL